MDVVKTFDALATHKVPEWMTLAVTLIATIGVAFEYARQKSKDRLELALEMIGKMTSDEQIAFAVTVLDWGTGKFIIPGSWVAAVGKATSKFDESLIWDALRPEITSKTARAPERLLYRRAFVELFNHMERIKGLVDSKALSVRDLEPMLYVAKQLLNWSYAVKHDSKLFFTEAMKGWYDNHRPYTLAVELCECFEPGKTSVESRIPSSESHFDGP